jgi:glycosyltransferase involved in cell wall biosynthesis
VKFLYHHRIRADDGQAVHVREMIGALRGLGHAVDECALVPKATATTQRRDASGGAADVPVSSRETAIGAGRTADGAAARTGRSVWQTLRLPRIATELLEIGYDRQGEARLVRAGRSVPPDVVYERHALHCASGVRAARRLGVPCLLEVNSPMCDEMAALGLLRFPRRARRSEREALGGADAVLAVSEVLAERLIELGAPRARVHVVRNGADPRRYPERTTDAVRAARRQLGLPESGRFLLGFVGYARPWHRLDLAVDVLAMPGFEHAELLVVGEGPALEALQEHATLRGVRQRLRLLGAVPGDELPRYVTAFDASLIPAINPYASPLKAFDALAAAVPVVAPRQPNLEELFCSGENGVLFAPDSADDLASALRPLAESPEHAAAVGAAGRRTLDANAWTWSGQAERVVEIARELVAGHRGGAASS